MSEFPIMLSRDDGDSLEESLIVEVIISFKIGELSCPMKYFRDASSINFRRSVKYGFGVLATTMKFVLCKMGAKKFKIFDGSGRHLVKIKEGG